MGIDKVGIDKVGIDQVGIKWGSYNHVKRIKREYKVRQDMACIHSSPGPSQVWLVKLLLPMHEQSMDQFMQSYPLRRTRFGQCRSSSNLHLEEKKMAHAV